MEAPGTILSNLRRRVRQQDGHIKWELHAMIKLIPRDGKIQSKDGRTNGFETNKICVRKRERVEVALYIQ